MLFSDLYKSPKSPLSKLRHSHNQALPSLTTGDFDADLLSRDKARQKDAVRRHLADKVRNDWRFTWPPSERHADERDGALVPTEHPDGAETSPAGAVTAPGDAKPGVYNVSPPHHDDSGAEADSEAESIYSTVSEDLVHYRSRAEWTSDLSDNESALAPPSPFRFDSPDAVGAVVQASASAGKRKRRREIRAEMQWNEGLACFNARRDAWTGAQTVRVKPKIPAPTSPTSPISPRRGLWRFHSHSKSDTTTLSSPTQTTPPPPASGPSPYFQGIANSQHPQQSAPDTITPPTSDRESQESSLHSTHVNKEYPVETLLPVPAPLLPPGNPMRASITPSIYTSLYDKVVVHSLQPSCPINLSDMIRSCVVGWKRDGEWPPRPMEIPPGANIVVVRRKKKDVVRDPAKGDAPTSPTLTTQPTRRLSISALLNRGSVSPEREHDESGTGKGIRRSIQRVFGLGGSHGHGHGHSASIGSINEVRKDEAAAI